jgi:hypothetical protein
VAFSLAVGTLLWPIGLLAQREKGTVEPAPQMKRL